MVRVPWSEENGEGGGWAGFEGFEHEADDGLCGGVEEQGLAGEDVGGRVAGDLLVGGLEFVDDFGEAGQEFLTEIQVGRWR